MKNTNHVCSLFSITAALFVGIAGGSASAHARANLQCTSVDAESTLEILAPESLTRVEKVSLKEPTKETQFSITKFENVPAPFYTQYNYQLSDASSNPAALTIVARRVIGRAGPIGDRYTAKFTQNGAEIKFHCYEVSQ